MIELRMSKGARPTGRLLLTLLQERGLEVTTEPGQNPQAIVSYGVTLPEQQVPVLNRAAGRQTKYQELVMLRDAGLLVPPFSIDGHGLQFPLLGRRLKHSMGRDIVPVLQNGVWLQRLVNEQVCEFFTQFIPKDREFRVWAYRRKPIAVYEKILRYPRRAPRDINIIWNWSSGYAFEFVPDAPDFIKALGALAVEAMKLDFGAVDLIIGQDGQPYILEVNTAPGVEDRRHGIVKLADKIARWAQLGFPRRNGGD